MTGPISTASPSPVPFAFKDHQIRTVVNGDGKPWFVAKDVCGALTVPWRGQETLRMIPAEWVGVRKLRTPNEASRGGLRGDITVIAEPAVYKLAFRSNKPEADEFTNWVASEVLPEIRKTGQFHAQPEPAPALSHRSTAKERNCLAALMDTYVGALGVTPSPEVYKTAWRKIHKLCGVKEIAHLTVDQVGQAEVFLQYLIDAAAPKALPEPEGPDLRALAVANYNNYMPELRTIERAVADARGLLLTVEDAVRRAAHEADGSSITLNTSLAQVSAGLVCSRAETIRHELRELEDMATLGFAGIATHLELKNARRRLREIERDSKGRYKAGEPLHVFR